MTMPLMSDDLDTNQLIKFQPLLLEHSSNLEDHDSTAISTRILSIIYKYRLNKAAHDRWAEGVPKFLDIIDNFVRKSQPVQMCLPAFPFKSVNKVNKVLGSLPDRAEEAALEHMNTMCDEISAIYAPGARLLIISDGLVYNGNLQASRTPRPTPVNNHADYINRPSHRSGSRSLGVWPRAPSPVRQKIPTHRIFAPQTARRHRPSRRTQRSHIRRQRHEFPPRASKSIRRRWAGRAPTRSRKRGHAVNILRVRTLLTQ